MKVLIVYGTTEGHTRKVARYMENVLQEQGHQVVIADATEDPPSSSDFEAVVVGSSIHVHRYHSALDHYIQENLKALNAKPSAFFSISMAMASDIEEEHQEVGSIADSYLNDVHWRPNKIGHFAGALKYSKYNYFKRLIMRMIAKKHGGDIDTSEDYEYTDWNQVEQFVTAFINEIK